MFQAMLFRVRNSKFQNITAGHVRLGMFAFFRSGKLAVKFDHA
jgi:hypothetical protein